MMADDSGIVVLDTVRRQKSSGVKAVPAGRKWRPASLCPSDFGSVIASVPHGRNP